MLLEKLIADHPVQKSKREKRNEPAASPRQTLPRRPWTKPQTIETAELKHRNQPTGKESTIGDQGKYDRPGTEEGCDAPSRKAAHTSSVHAEYTRRQHGDSKAASLVPNHEVTDVRPQNRQKGDENGANARRALITHCCVASQRRAASRRLTPIPSTSPWSDNAAIVPYCGTP